LMWRETPERGEKKGQIELLTMQSREEWAKKGLLTTDDQIKKEDRERKVLLRGGKATGGKVS